MNQRGSSEAGATEGRRRSSGVVLSLLLLVFCAFAAGHWQSKQVVSNIHVSGTSGLSDKAVREVLDMCIAARRSTVDLAHVRDSLESIPFVENAHVFFDGVRSVKAEITERCPVAHIVSGDGTVKYIDAHGTILPPAVVRTAHDVPVVRRSDGAPLTSEQRAGIARMLTIAKDRLSTVLYEAVSEVVVDRDVVKMRTQVGTWQIASGCGDCAHEYATIQSSFDKLNVFAERTGLRSGDGVQLDLRWHNHVVVTRVG